MAKRNVQKNSNVAERLEEQVQGVQEGTTGTAPAQAQENANAGEQESAEEKLPVQSGQDNGEQPDDTEAAELDTESKAKTNGEEGSETDDTVTAESEETTEQRNRIAADVFAKNSQCKELHFTSDLVPFFLKSDAVRHGATLDEDTIVTINKV